MKLSGKFALLIALLMISTPAFCQDKDLVINAQNMSYNEEHGFYEASGSAEVIFKDIKASGDKILYYAAQKRIYTDSGFKLEYQGMDFIGKTLDFNLSARTGEAKDVTLYYQNIKLNGKEVNISPSNIELLDADFTTCNMHFPHYSFRAQKIVLYPNEGWFICYWAIFWIDGIPTMPVPIYVYDLKAREKGMTQFMPYPQFGSNDTDGTFISQSFPWHARKNLNGNIFGSYATKKGMGCGFDLKYEKDSQNKGKVHLSGNASDPISSIFEHCFFFGPEIFDHENFVFDLLKVQNFRQYDLTTKLSLNERINYEKVSMLPYLKLTLNKGLIGRFVFDGSLGLGFVSEEGTSSGLSHVRANFLASTTLLESWAGVLTPKIDNDLIFYGNSTHWIRLNGIINTEKTWANKLITNIGYKHLFIDRGASPYRFEVYRFVPNDQVFAGFMAGEGTTKYGINSVYNLPNMDIQELDYIFRLGVHCFNITCTYRAGRKEFNFSFGIN